MKELDDFSLVRRYAEERSEDAFRELVERHSEAVFRLCRRRLCDAQLAEDATQKTFAILARKAADVQKLPIRPYLYRIATGCCADIRKERARRAKRKARLNVSAQMVAESKQTRMLIAAMEEAFERLSGKYRDAIELRYVLDFSVPEVADALKISVPAAKQRLVRGLAELRSQLTGNAALGIVILAKLFPLLRADLPEGLAARTATAALREAQAPSIPARPRAENRRRPLLRVGAVGALTATGVLAVTMAPLLRQPQRIAIAQSASKASVLLSPTPPLLTPPPSFLDKLHHPYGPIDFAGPQFKQALRVTSHLTGVAIDCDWRSIEAVGVSRTAEIESRGAPGDVLGEFLRIIKAADRHGRVECIVGPDHLLIRARQVTAHS